MLVPFPVHKVRAEKSERRIAYSQPVALLKRENGHADRRITQRVPAILKYSAARDAVPESRHFTSKGATGLSLPVISWDTSVSQRVVR
jgi:hypothetical protein